MKKIKQLIIILLMVLTVMLFTGCTDDSGLAISCKHTYVLESTETSCIKEGKTIYKCSKCGREITIIEEAKSHTLELIELVDSTCSEEGHKKEKCSVCGEVIESVVEKKPHTLELKEFVDSTCKTEGHKIEKCSVCHAEVTTTIEKKEHTFGDWSVKTHLVDATHNLESRECSECHTEETRLVSTILEMDLTIINYDIAKSTHVATSIEEAGIIFNAAILNNKADIDIKLDFAISDYNTFFDKLEKLRSVPFDYKVSSSYNPGTKVMSLEFTYINIPSKTTPKTVSYVQAPSANVVAITPTRASDYNNFKINSATASYAVSTSEQLVYVLEHRAKPVPVTDSQAEDIYNKILTVLREIITDDMTDAQKTKAIHDWLVMNVTYDQELVDLMGSSDIKSYNGFYLEGVFNDKYAVCEGISKALCVMANIEGIPCVRVTGHQTGNAGGVGHAWNKIYVDGDWYIIDATSDGTIINSTTEILSYEYFLISDATMLTKYTGEEYNDYTCTKNYDYFENNSVTYKDKTMKFAVHGQSELNDLINYFVKTSQAKGTIQIKFDFAYGDKYDDEVSVAYTLAGGTKSYGFVRGGNVALIMLNE